MLQYNVIENEQLAFGIIKKRKKNTSSVNMYRAVAIRLILCLKFSVNNLEIDKNFYKTG